MAVSKDDLMNVAENSFFFMPEVPGFWERNDLDGLKLGWSSASHWPMVNMVGDVRLNAEEADAAIQQVHEFYTSRDRPYQWFFAVERVTPPDMGERLEAAGLVKSVEFAGMAMTELNLEVETNPAISVREDTSDGKEDFIQVMARGYPAPEAIVRGIINRRFDAVNARRYVAYLGDEPVAGASMFYVPGLPVVMLQGAATVERHRGKGAYSALLKRRLQDAKADGMEAAVLQANRATSAPICAKYGFEELCGIEVYVWKPEGEAGH